jgi:hypothetical protein
MSTRKRREPGVVSEAATGYGMSGARRGRVKLGVSVASGAQTHRGEGYAMRTHVWTIPEDQPEILAM